MSYFDEIDENIPQWEIGKNVEFKLPEISSYYPVFSYRYISLDKGEYCFNNPLCSLEKFINYFEVLREISSKSINDWLQAEYGKNYYFKIEPVISKGKVKEILEKIAGRKLSEKQIPIVGHFHLSKKEDRDKNSDATVVHFFIGQRGEFFIFALDLKHTIHPIKH